MTGAETAIIVSSIAAASVAGYSAYAQGRDAKTQARSEAAWHNYNSKLAERRAEAERKQAILEAKQHRRKSKQLLARQKSLIGASGVEMEGSPLLVAEDTAGQLAIEEAQIRQMGIRRVGAFKSQSVLDTLSAASAKSRGDSAYKAGLLGAGSSILSGASDAAYKKYMMDN